MFILEPDCTLNETIAYWCFISIQ